MDGWRYKGCGECFGFQVSVQRRGLKVECSANSICSSRTKADKARQVLGWKPKYGEDVFWEEVDDVVAVMSEHH